MIVHHVSSSRSAEYFFGYIYQSRRWVILLLSTNISDFLLFFFFFIVRPVLKIITTNISKYKRAAILYNGSSSIKTLCRCDNERNNHFPFDLVYLDAQQHKTLKDENSWKRRIRLIVVVLAVQNMNRSLFGTRIQEPSHHVQATFPHFFFSRILLKFSVLSLCCIPTQNIYWRWPTQATTSTSVLYLNNSTIIPHM